MFLTLSQLTFKKHETAAYSELLFSEILKTAATFFDSEPPYRLDTYIRSQDNSGELFNLAKAIKTVSSDIYVDTAHQLPGDSYPNSLSSVILAHTPDCEIVRIVKELIILSIPCLFVNQWEEIKSNQESIIDYGAYLVPLQKDFIMQAFNVECSKLAAKEGVQQELNGRINTKKNHSWGDVNNRIAYVLIGTRIENNSTVNNYENSEERRAGQLERMIVMFCKRKGFTVSRLPEISLYEPYIKGYGLKIECGERRNFLSEYLSVYFSGIHEMRSRGLTRRIPVHVFAESLCFIPETECLFRYDRGGGARGQVIDRLNPPWVEVEHLASGATVFMNSFSNLNENIDAARTILASRLLYAQYAPDWAKFQLCRSYNFDLNSVTACDGKDVGTNLTDVLDGKFENEI